MKIVCDACQAKYSIADDIVQGKPFKIRCKKCGHIIVVRTSPAADGSVLAELRNVPSNELATSAPVPGTDTPVWHIVLDGEQVGPLTEAEIRYWLLKRRINAETLVWREGMPDWASFLSVPTSLFSNKGTTLLGSSRIAPSANASERRQGQASTCDGLPSVVEAPIATLKDFVEATTKICHEHVSLNSTREMWFRGQADDRWHLTPGIYRAGALSRYEREMVRDFRLRAYQDTRSTPNSDLEVLFMMQHYGMPTRLLVWSENPLVALFFALVGAGSAGNPVVWILNPWCLNVRTLNGEKSIPTADHPAFQKYVLPRPLAEAVQVPEAQWPAAIRPNHTNERITAQAGVFTIHGSAHQGLDEQFSEISVWKDPSQWILSRIPIDRTARRSIMRDLFTHGATYSALFPDLDGLAKSISYRYSTAYMTAHIALPSESEASAPEADMRPDESGELASVGEQSSLVEVTQLGMLAKLFKRKATD